MTPLRQKVLWAALQRARGLERRADVLAVGIGQRRRQGHWIEDETCIVVKVKWKLEGSQLGRERRRPLPRAIEVAVGKRKYRVGVDVQETGGQVVGRCQGCVGGPLTTDGQLRGGVGLVVSDGGEAKVLISGHVGKKAGVHVVAGNVKGVTETPVMTALADHCLVVPEEPLSPQAPRLVDGTPLSGIAAPATLSVGDTLFFHRSETGRRTPVVLRHIDISAPFDYPDGVHRLKHLLATDGSTVEGDSGTLLFDASFKAVATLLGVFGNESYFIPCTQTLDVFGLALVT